MEELLKKTFRLEIETSKEVLNIDFGETNFQEVCFLEKALKTPEGIFVFLRDFLEKNNIEDEIFLDIAEEEREKMSKFILEKISGGYFQFSKKSTQKSAIKTINASWVCIFLKETGHTLSDLKKMKWSEISFLLEGISWNANEQSDKGKRLNQANLIRKQQKQLKQAEKKSFLETLENL